MSVRNVTFDDFDPVIVYSNPADWTTPNPQVCQRLQVDHLVWNVEN